MTAVLNPTEEPINDADVEWVLEEFGNALAAKLFGRLAAMNAPLAKERNAKGEEARTLRGSHAELQRRVAAQSRILAAEIDRAIAEGRDDDAEAKRQECAGLEQSLRRIPAQAEVCEQRCREITHKIAANYRACFEQSYPEIRSSLIAAEVALLKLLDGVEAGLLRYEAESGRRLLTNQHLLDLTPRETGQERPYFASLRRWFGGRG